MVENSVKKVLRVIKTLDVGITSVKVIYDEDSDNVVLKYKADDVNYAYDAMIDAFYDEDIYEVDCDIDPNKGKGKIYLEV